MEGVLSIWHVARDIERLILNQFSSCDFSIHNSVPRTILSLTLINLSYTVTFIVIL